MAVPLLFPAGFALRRDPLGLLAALFALLLVLLAFLPVQRAMERRSDAAGHAASPAAYALALERLYEWNLAPAVFRRKRAHPDLVDRMAAAGAPPAWPRPAPPPAVIGPVLVVGLATALLVVGIVLSGAFGFRGEGEAAYLRAVALRGHANDLGWLAFSRYSAGKLDEALPLFRAAHGLDPRDAAWPAWEAIALSVTGRCEEARASLEVAAAIDGAAAAVVSAARVVPTCIPR